MDASSLRRSTVRCHTFAVLVPGLMLAVPGACASEPAQPQLSVHGTEFVLTLSDGRVLKSMDLVGATLLVDTAAGQMEITIKHVEFDGEAVGGQVWLHHFTVRDAAGQDVDLCKPDPQGNSLGFPIPDGRGGFELTCTSGVAGKCVRWGYRPWEETPNGRPLRALHETCVHMARADYGGDGKPTTRDGTLIDVYDRYGIQMPDAEAALPFEAAWGVDGALCVAHPRIPENISLPQLAERYPQLRSRLGPDKCSEEALQDDPRALIFNRSLDRSGSSRDGVPPM
jgi:hypothetical protein